MFNFKKTKPVENTRNFQSTSCHEHKHLQDLKILNMEAIVELGVGYETNPYVFVYPLRAWPNIEGVCTECSAVVRKSMVSESVLLRIIDELRERLSKEKTKPQSKKGNLSKAE